MLATFTVLLACLAWTTAAAWTNVLFVCPDAGCAEGDQLNPVGAALLQLRQSAKKLHVVAGTLDSGLGGVSWDVAIVSSAVRLEFRTVALRVASPKTVVIIDDPRAASPVDPSADSSSTGPTVVTVPAPTAQLALTAAPLLCRLTSQGSIYFSSDGWGSWDRSFRAGLVDALSLFCPSITLMGNYGPITTSKSVGTADVVIAFGPNATAMAQQQLVKPSSSCVQIIPVVLSSSAEATSFLSTTSYVQLQQAMSVGTVDALRSVSSSTVATVNKACCSLLCNATLWEITFASSKLFLPRANVTSFVGPEINLKKAVVTNPGNAKNVGTAYSLMAGGLLYVIPSTLQQQVTVYDPLSHTMDSLGIYLTLPRAAAFAPLPPEETGNALAKAFVHGGIYGTTFSPKCGFLTVHSPANLTFESFYCNACPPAAMYHTATAVPGRGVGLFGGQLATFYLSNAVSWFNFTSMDCDEEEDTSVIRPAARMRHGATAWMRHFTMSGVEDNAWLVISSGFVSATPVFDAWLFAVTKKQWVQLTVPDSLNVDPCQKPLVATIDTTLLIVGQSGAVVFSAAMGTWEGVSNTFHGYFASPAEVIVANLSAPHTFAINTMINDARGCDAAWSAVLQVPSCGGNSVPSLSLDGCTPCPAHNVKEEGICVPCSWRHFRPSSSYSNKVACWPNYESLCLVGFVLISIVTLLIPFFSRFAMWYINGLANAERNQTIALEVTKAVAGLTLERVAQLDSVTHPTKVELSMKCCVANLKRFRLAIPDAVLRVVDSCTKQMEQTTDAGSKRDDEVSETSTEVRTMVSTANTERDNAKFTQQQQRRHSSLFATSVAMNDSDRLVSALLSELTCALRLGTAAVTVFSVGDMPKWAETQRGSELPKRVARLYDLAVVEVSKSGGVVDAIIGDRFYASWATSVQLKNADCLLEASRCALSIVRSSTVDRLGLTLHAGVASGNVRCGFVGCQGESAPPYRQFTVLGPVVVDATNLSQAAKHLRLGVLINWGHEERLRRHFIVKFTALLKFGNLMGPQIYAGELMCTTTEKETLWDMMRLADTVAKFNYFIANARSKQPTAAESSMLRDELPPSYLSALQHSLVTGKLPQEIVPRMW